MRTLYILLLLTTCVWCIQCPDRWVQFQGSCYLFGHDHLHFTEAVHYCNQHHGNLVEVETREENMFLKDFLSDLKPDKYWLGMTDENVEGIWRWYSSDEYVQFTDWSPKQPDNWRGAEDCAVYDQLAQYTWNDDSCTDALRPLCEISDNTHVVVG